MHALACFSLGCWENQQQKARLPTGVRNSSNHLVFHPICNQAVKQFDGSWKILQSEITRKPMDTLANPSKILSPKQSIKMCQNLRDDDFFGLHYLRYLLLTPKNILNITAFIHALCRPGGADQGFLTGKTKKANFGGLRAREDLKTVPKGLSVRAKGTKKTKKMVTHWGFRRFSRKCMFSLKEQAA